LVNGEGVVHGIEESVLQMELCGIERNILAFLNPKAQSKRKKKYQKKRKRKKEKQAK
jgi:hypothetical protein